MVVALCHFQEFPLKEVSHENFNIAISLLAAIIAFSLALYKDFNHLLIPTKRSLLIIERFVVSGLQRDTGTYIEN